MALLPHGARGIDLGEFAIEVGRDKLVLIEKSATEHYTLHVGTASGILDVHRTGTDEHSNKQHETLFAIKRDDLISIIQKIGEEFPDPHKLIRRLRIGWMARNNIGLAYGLDPVTDEELAAVTMKSKRRLVPDHQRLEANIKIPEYLDDVYDQPDGTFTILQNGTRIGIGVKQTGAHGAVRLRWIKLRDLQRQATRWGTRFLALLEEHAIPRSEYHEHSVLKAPTSVIDSMQNERISITAEDPTLGASRTIAVPSA